MHDYLVHTKASATQTSDKSMNARRQFPYAGATRGPVYGGPVGGPVQGRLSSNPGPSAGRRSPSDQLYLAAGVPEQHRVVGAERPLANVVDEATHGLGGVRWIEKKPV